MMLIKLFAKRGNMSDPLVEIGAQALAKKLLTQKGIDEFDWLRDFSEEERRALCEQAATVLAATDHRRFRVLAEWLVTMSENDDDRLPVAVSDMTTNEHAIFNLTAKYLGQLQFLSREASSMLCRDEGGYRAWKAMVQSLQRPI
jgi:hypothetical protein